MSIVKNAPVDDEGPTGYESDDAAVSSLMKSWGSKEEPEEEPEYEPEGDPEDEPEGDPEEDPEEDPEGDPEEDPEGDPEENPEEDPKSKAKTADDDAVTEVRVGDKVHKVAVKDLKRLFGQEQALTQKSQEVAQLREAADKQFQRSAVSLQRQVEKAKARASQFDKINLTVLARDSRVSDEEIRAIMADQEAARADVSFFEGELDDLVKEHNEEQGKAFSAAFKGQAEAARKVLTDPSSSLHIPQFDKAYQSVLEYGVRQGIPAREMANEVNPLAINTLWKAMKYDAGQAALKAKGKKVVAKVPVTRKVAKPGASDPGTGKVGVTKAFNRFRQSGSDDDAVNYYLAKTGAEVD